ncbi:MAG: siderophore-interacting protein [Dehalococcoidia bacterium]
MASPEQTPLRQTSGAVKKRPSPRTVDVLRVTRVTPSMVRIKLGGEQMEGFATKGPAEHIRVYLPHAETGELVLPVPGPDGYAFPEDRERPKSRAYTPRRWDPEKRELDIDILLHGDGPGSAWASNVQEGDVAVISGQPGGPYLPEMDLDWYIIAGDEAAMPAIGTLLEVLPSSMRTHVYIEVPDEAEKQELQTDSRMELTWVHPGVPGAHPGRALAEALRQAELPDGDGRIWVSCEASVMRDIRRHFLEERGVDRAMLRTQGYWKAGETNHTDHDMGDDV